MKTGRRAIVMVDGQNLYHGAREAFGHTMPLYDVKMLAEMLCKQADVDLQQARFYSGVPAKRDNAFWHDFWAQKLLGMSRSGVEIFTRELRYRNVSLKTDGAAHVVRAPQEKGIDVRIAIDAIRLAQRREFDALILVTQDQDLSEVVTEVRLMAEQQGRPISVFSAFPISELRSNQRGVNKTQWLPIDRAAYEECLDRMNYAPDRAKAVRPASSEGRSASPSVG